MVDLVGYTPPGTEQHPLRVPAPPEILRTSLENGATTNIFTIINIFIENVFILNSFLFNKLIYLYLVTCLITLYLTPDSWETIGRQLGDNQRKVHTKYLISP